jgi:acetamidase/formamidase
MRLDCIAAASAVVVMMSLGFGAAVDATEVIWQNRVAVAKEGAHCVDDANCFNRYHPANPILSSVAVDLVVGQVVDVPNYTVSAILDLGVFEEQ